MAILYVVLSLWQSIAESIKAGETKGHTRSPSTSSLKGHSRTASNASSTSQEVAELTEASKGSTDITGIQGS